MLKAETPQALQKLFTNIWENETYPTVWTQGILVKVPTKGDLSVCGNWRGIMLLVKISNCFVGHKIQDKVDATETANRVPRQS